MSLSSGQPSPPGESEKFGVIIAFLHAYFVTFLGSLRASQGTYPVLSCASEFLGGMTQHDLGVRHPGSAAEFLFILILVFVG